MENENFDDKTAIVEEVLSMPKVCADLLMHDDACHFEAHVKKKGGRCFKRIKFYVIDKWHRRNHKCSKKKLTRAEKARCKNTRTNMSESFNAWMRGLNFFLNGLTPSSHRFWVDEAIRFYNNNVVDRWVFPRTRRSNIVSRSKRK